MSAESAVLILQGILPYLMPLFALIALLTALRLYQPFLAGWWGKARVRRALAPLPADRYTLLHDLLLPCQDGSYTQIDHVVIGPSALFVIETKNHAGLIFGRPTEPQWRQVLNRRSKFNFQNPLHQNERHVQAVLDAVGELPTHSLVIFVRGNFPDGWPEGVVNPKLLRLTIQEQESDAPAFEREAVAADLRSAVITAAAARRQYRKAVRQRHGDPLRLPVAHTLVVLATALLLLAPHHWSQPAPAPQAKVAAPVKYAVPAPPPEVQASGPKATAPAAARSQPMPTFEIIALGRGRASLKVNGKIFTLRTGQKRYGWQLISASPLHADLIQPNGKHFHYEP